MTILNTLSQQHAFDPSYGRIMRRQCGIGASTSGGIAHLQQVLTPSSGNILIVQRDTDTTPRVRFVPLNALYASCRPRCQHPRGVATRRRERARARDTIIDKQRSSEIGEMHKNPCAAAHDELFEERPAVVSNRQGGNYQQQLRERITAGR